MSPLGRNAYLLPATARVADSLSSHRVNIIGPSRSCLQSRLEVRAAGTDGSRPPWASINAKVEEIERREHLLAAPRAEEDRPHEERVRRAQNLRFE
jgi:hypothetical protein